MATSLNELGLPTDGFPEKQKDYGIRAKCQITCHFKELSSKLCEYIRSADEVYGCVAWLTDEAILSALASRERASIIVQKEDFLRPDAVAQSKVRLRELYASIKGSYRSIMPTAQRFSICCDPTVEGVRCVGVHQVRGRVSPRMHHKFVVFCRTLIEEPSTPYELDNPHEMPIPYAVWTGSFNFTKNASLSLENGLYIESEEVANAYYAEYCQVLLLSEPLNWSSEYVEPEWRVGT